MSIQLMVAAMAAPVKSAAAKLVLIALADRANDDGVCWPSIGKVAAAVNMSAAAVHRHLRTLEIDGWSMRRPRFDPTGRQTSNEFILAGLMGEGVTSDTPPCHEGGGCHPVTGGRVSPADTLNMNPQKEPPTNTPYSPPHEKPKRKAPSLMSEDWRPSPEAEAFAKSIGIDPTASAAEFRDFWIGIGKTRADWNATYRNRCRDLAAKGWKPPPKTNGRAGFQI